MTALLPLVLAALFVSHATADETTLVVPFVDPQAVSAKPIGTDAANTRTTYELAQGAYTGTWTDPQGSFPGTATLVEGADYASFTYVVANPEGSFTVGGECSFTADGAGAVVEECVAVQVPTDGVGGTFTVTDTATPFGLQVAAATGAPAGSGSGAGAGTGASASETASAGGSTPTGAATALRLGLSAAAAAPLAGALLLL